MTTTWVLGKTELSCAARTVYVIGHDWDVFQVYPRSLKSLLQYTAVFSQDVSLFTLMYGQDRLWRIPPSLYAGSVGVPFTVR